MDGFTRGPFWGGRHPTCKECRKAIHHSQPDDVRARRLLYCSRKARDLKYGAGAWEWYEERFVSQHGLCAICGLPQQRKKLSRGVRERLCIHHDHLTGRLVALICSDCNFVLEHELRRPGRCEKVAAFVRDEIMQAGKLTG